MNTYKYFRFLPVLLLSLLASDCTKLDQKLNSALTSGQAASALGANGVQLLLQTAYNDVGNPYSDLGNVFALEEVTGDECLIPTRGKDWDDNGKWRALHLHNWTVEGVDIFLNMFNALNKINFDGTNVLQFNPSPNQAAQARFIRALALYQLLDLYGQFPFRNPGDNLLNAPKVYSGDSAVQFIINELTTILPDLDPGNTIAQANQDAAKVLLMKLYLNHGAFVNRENPTFDDADMQKVITLGNEIIGSSKYSYMPNYFYNFDVAHGGANSTEAIFSCPNSSGVATNNTGISNRWFATLHYNQYQSVLGSAGGWNGFSTVADFYNSFSLTGTTAQGPADTLLDPRIGGRYYPGSTDKSGVRPGLLIGQQYDEHGSKYHDRQGNLLIFDPNIAADLKETGSNLEVTGIRAVKYPPDYSKADISYNNGGNWCVIFRYSDVVLMVAEAKMRQAAADDAGALAMVNDLRAARGTVPLPSMTLVNTSNVYDPLTLLAERGRELYWEGVRRTDLIRFGVFLKPWAYKTTDDAHYLLFPIPTSALAANPNLKQNPGYN
jgi:hypothetical protein